MSLFHAIAGLACLVPAGLVAMPDPQAPCARAAAAASNSTGVPYAVLIAISQTETGRAAQGDTATWPWAINDSGEGHYFASRDEAITYAEEALAAGRLSFDLGCFQLNYRWHGANFTSVREMLDPEENAMHAARFLADLYAESGDWSVAAGAYHSRTPTLAAAYRTRFDTFHARAQTGPTLAQNMQTPGANHFPLLQPGRGDRAIASLVPLDL